MSKNMIRGYITLAVVFVVFSVIALAVPFANTPAFWIAYVFGVIAIGYQVYVINISFAKGVDVKSKFYGFPIAKIGLVYLIAQLIISLLEMCVAAFIPAWVAMVIDIIPVAAAVVGCIAADAMREEVVRQDEQVKVDVSNMREMQSLSLSLVAQCQDETLKAKLQKLADEFRYSDPVTSENTEKLEKDMEVQLKELQKVLSEGDLETSRKISIQLTNTLVERNRICSLNK